MREVEAGTEVAGEGRGAREGRRTDRCHCRRSYAVDGCRARRSEAKEAAEEGRRPAVADRRAMEEVVAAEEVAGSVAVCRRSAMRREKEAEGELKRRAGTRHRLCSANLSAASRGTSRWTAEESYSMAGEGADPSTSSHSAVWEEEAVEEVEEGTGTEMEEVGCSATKRSTSRTDAEEGEEAGRTAADLEEREVERNATTVAGCSSDWRSAGGRAAQTLRAAAAEGERSSMAEVASTADPLGTLRIRLLRSGTPTIDAGTTA